MEGTRTAVLKCVQGWAASESKLFWLHGVAGSGKSCIVNLVSHIFDQEQRLLGCFFCKKDNPDCRVPDNIIPTLAFHFSKWHKSYRSTVASVIQGRDGLKLAQGLQWQFELLMKQPMMSLNAVPNDLPLRPLIVVIDALDECRDSPESRSKLASILVQMSALVPWMKIFITSRLLPEFEEVFLKDADQFQFLDINTEIDLEEVHGDILQYMRYRVRNFGLTEGEILALAARASGLFIWTSTVFRFIGMQHDKKGAVSSISLSSLMDSQEAELDKVYTTVINAASASPENTKVVKAILGFVVCTARNRPLPESALVQFLVVVEQNVTLKVVEETIDFLQAVLYRDMAKEGAVRVCHPSFIDFISSQVHSGKYWTDPVHINALMAKRCIQLMFLGLKFNIYELDNSYLSNDQVSGLYDGIYNFIPHQLQYSCLYWMNHLAASDQTFDEQAIQDLLQEILCHPRALYWLECLSLMKELKSGINTLENFSKHYQVCLSQSNSHV